MPPRPGDTQNQSKSNNNPLKDPTVTSRPTSTARRVAESELNRVMAGNDNINGASPNSESIPLSPNPATPGMESFMQAFMASQERSAKAMEEQAKALSDQAQASVAQAKAFAEQAKAFSELNGTITTLVAETRRANDLNKATFELISTNSRNVNVVPESTTTTSASDEMPVNANEAADAATNAANAAGATNASESTSTGARQQSVHFKQEEDIYHVPPPPLSNAGPFSNTGTSPQPASTRRPFSSNYYGDSTYNQPGPSDTGQHHNHTNNHPNNNRSQSFTPNGNNGHQGSHRASGGGRGTGPPDDDGDDDDDDENDPRRNGGNGNGGGRPPNQPNNGGPDGDPPDGTPLGDYGTNRRPGRRATPGAEREFDLSRLSEPRTFREVPKLGSFKERVFTGIERIIREKLYTISYSLPDNSLLKNSTFTCPTFAGEDDLAIFQNWLVKLCSWLRAYKLVGSQNDAARRDFLSRALTGKAETWYFHHVMGPRRDRYFAENSSEDTFTNHVKLIACQFITPASCIQARQRYDKIRYDSKQGIRAFMKELEYETSQMLEEVDDYSIRKRMFNSVPQALIKIILRNQNLSIITTNTEAWVDAIESEELRMAEESIMFPYQSRDKETERTPRGYRTSNNTGLRYDRKDRRHEETKGKPSVSAIHATTPPTSDAKQYRKYDKRTEGKPPRDLKDVTCYSCGGKGHYSKSKECPNTMDSAHLHLISIGEIEDLPEAVLEDYEREVAGGERERVDEFTEDEEHSDDDDPYGTGYAISSIHVCNDDEREDVELQIAAISKSNFKEDEDLAREIEETIRDSFEARGSGHKAPKGPTRSQLAKANKTNYASNANVRPAKHKAQDKATNRQGLSTVVKIDGVEALVLFDSGSEIDCISPDFARAIGLQHETKDSPVLLKLATKGQHSTCSYEVKPTLEFAGNVSIPVCLDVINLDRWDILLGSPFSNMFGVLLNFKDRTINWDDVKIPALPSDQEAAYVKTRHTRRAASKSD